MHHTRYRTILAAGLLSGIPRIRAPRAGWRRDDPSTGGNHGGGGGGGNPPGDDDQGDKDDQGDDAGGKKPEIKGDVDPDRVARALAAAREGEKKAKAEAKAAKERTEAILRAAGLTPDGKTDPAEQLAAARKAADEATAKARQHGLELAVYRTAGKAGADADALLDSRGFLAAVADLDHDASDFTDQIRDAIKAAVKANPKLAAAPANTGPGKQGADHSGGGGAKERPKSLREAFARKQQQ